MKSYQDVASRVCLVSLMLSCLSPLYSQTSQPNSSNAKSVYDQSKDVGASAPKAADVPFDGSQNSLEANWEMWPKKDMKITWSLVDAPNGSTKVLMTNGGKKWGTHDLVTKKKYTDFEGHVDFVLMGAREDDQVEGYANSGVYLQNRYELQIESPKGKNAKDPYNWKIGPHGIGAFCMEHVPDHNAWRPNGKWQSFHFIFKAARWDGEKMVEPARATVWWNGVKVHDNVAIKHANGGEKVDPTPQGLKLQEHGQDVRFRNVWIVDQTNKKEGDQAIAKPEKIEVRHSMLGYRDTLVFYHFKKQPAIFAVKLSNQNDSFKLTGQIHVFDKSVSPDDLKKWINNQHSDGLFPDIPEPIASKKITEADYKITSSEKTGTSTNPGPAGGTYNDFKVNVKFKALEVNGVKLPEMQDSIRAHVKKAD